MNYTDRICSTKRLLTTCMEDLIAQKYQFPTFHRDVVFEKEEVKKIWDSIYKVYPLGSIVIWKTDLILQNHKQIFGHQLFEPNINRSAFQYIIDGQKKLTLILTSLYGGNIQGHPAFNPLLYIDLTVPVESMTDEEHYRTRFLFWTEIEDHNGEIRTNIG